MTKTIKLHPYEAEWFPVLGVETLETQKETAYTKFFDVPVEDYDAFLEASEKFKIAERKLWEAFNAAGWGDDFYPGLYDK